MTAHRRFLAQLDEDIVMAAIAWYLFPVRTLEESDATELDLVTVEKKLEDAVERYRRQHGTDETDWREYLKLVKGRDS